MIDANIAIIPAPTITIVIIIESEVCVIPGVVGGCISNRTKNNPTKPKNNKATLRYPGLNRFILFLQYSIPLLVVVYIFS
jgi:hypothetical protein